jgi:3-hydroxymyristoyl/3-hydroxydecanoyl-(acyl carrier protein) dehydratase
MRFLKYTIFLLLMVRSGYAQNFSAELRKLNTEINAAKKAGKLTEVEFVKLKNEQDIIKLAIEKANADNVMTPGEKNKIHSKIIRSKKRLAKYKTNREVY